MKNWYGETLYDSALTAGVDDDDSDSESSSVESDLESEGSSDESDSSSEDSGSSDDDSDDNSDKMTRDEMMRCDRRFNTESSGSGDKEEYSQSVVVETVEDNNEEESVGVNDEEERVEADEEESVSDEEESISDDSKVFEREHIPNERTRSGRQPKLPKDLTEIYDINAMNLAHLEEQLGVTSKEEMEYADDLMVAIAKVMCKFAQMEKDVSHFMRPKKAKTFMRTAKHMKGKDKLLYQFIQTDSLKASLKKFGQQGRHAAQDEMKQLQD